MQPPDVSRNLESLERAQLAWGSTSTLAGISIPTCSKTALPESWPWETCLLFHWPDGTLRSLPWEDKCARAGPTPHSTFVQYEKGTPQGRYSLTSGDWPVSMVQAGLTRTQLPSPLGALLQGTTNIYNSSDFYCPFAVLIFKCYGQNSNHKVF